MINFTNCDLLTYSSQNRFLGNGIFRYGSTKNLTIEGNILDLQNMQGVSGVFSGVQKIVKDANDFDLIILNGIDFGSGRVLSINFDAGTWVRSTRYQAQIEVYNSGNLFNLTGDYYGNLTGVLNNSSTQTPLIQSFDESYDFSQIKKGRIEVNHNFSFKFFSGITNPIDLAKQLAPHFSCTGILYANTPPAASIATGLLYNIDFYGVSTGIIRSGEIYTTESYNTITNECAFTEKLYLDPSGKSYFIKSTQSVTTNEDGITTVVENGDIKGLIRNTYKSALSGYNQQIVGAYNRCLDVFNAYCDSSFYPLLNDPIAKQQTQNKFEGSISYSITFTNNPFYYTGYFWDYTQSISEDPDTIITVSEDGNVRGFGRLNTQEKFDKAISGYNVVKPGILGRANAFYLEFQGTSATLNLINRSETRSPYKGEISYSRQYNDDPNFVDDPFIKKVEVIINKTIPKHIFQSYSIVNNKELVQIGGNTDLAQDQLQIKLTTIPSGTFNRDYFLNYCRSICTGYKTGILYTDPFYRNVSYNFSDIEHTFDFELTYLSSSGKAFNDLSLNW